MHTPLYSLPDLYDILHAPGTAGDLRVLRRIERRYVARSAGPRRWLEPACGTGRHLLAAARAGIPGVGFDIERGMIAYARAKVRRVAASKRPRFFVAAKEDFDERRRLGRFTFAFNTINTIRHLPTDSAMLRHFAAVSRVLRPGGVYAVGISLAAYGLETITEDVWRGRRGGTAATQVIQYIPPTGSRGDAARAERVISHITVTRGGREAHVDSTYALRSYNLSQWTGLIGRTGWTVAGVTDGAGDPAEPREPGYYLFVLRPPVT
jgi:SAM-dependent methyltransferase